MVYLIAVFVGIVLVIGGAVLWKKYGPKASADALALKEAASIVADAVNKAP